MDPIARSDRKPPLLFRDFEMQMLSGDVFCWISSTFPNPQTNCWYLRAWWKDLSFRVRKATKQINIMSGRLQWPAAALRQTLWIKWFPASNRTLVYTRLGVDPWPLGTPDKTFFFGGLSGFFLLQLSFNFAKVNQEQYVIWESKQPLMIRFCFSPTLQAAGR